MAMKNIYRVYMIGDIPHDLKERISAIHASAIMKSEGVDRPVQGSVKRIDKSVSQFRR